MDEATLDEICGALLDTAREYPFGPGTVVWKVAGKLFALWTEGSDPFRVNLKCDPEEALALRASYDAVQPGYHMNKRHWNTISLDGSLDAAQVRGMVEDSYDLVVEGLPAATRRRIEFLRDA